MKQYIMTGRGICSKLSYWWYNEPLFWNSCVLRGGSGWGYSHLNQTWARAQVCSSGICPIYFCYLHKTDSNWCCILTLRHSCSMDISSRETSLGHLGNGLPVLWLASYQLHTINPCTAMSDFQIVYLCRTYKNQWSPTLFSHVCIPPLLYILKVLLSCGGRVRRFQDPMGLEVLVTCDI